MLRNLAMDLNLVWGCRCYIVSDPVPMMQLLKIRPPRSIFSNNKQQNRIHVIELTSGEACISQYPTLSQIPPLSWSWLSNAEQSKYPNGYDVMTTAWMRLAERGERTS